MNRRKKNKKRDLKMKDLKKLRRIIKNNVPKNVRFFYRLVKGLNYDKVEAFKNKINEKGKSEEESLVEKINKNETPSLSVSPQKALTKD